MREPDFLMAETIEKSSCIKNGHCRHLRTNPGNQSFARKRTIRKMAITDKSLKIAVFGSILNGVDDDFSTPFFVFTKNLRNAIK